MPRIVALALMLVLMLVLSAGSAASGRLVAQQQQGNNGNMARNDRWREDVRVFARELTAKHKNAYAYVDKAAFARAVAELDSAIPRLSDAQVQLRIARLAALVRDVHTATPLPAYALRLPLTMLWLDDGPSIVNATDDHRALIGARIARVNGHDIREAADSIRQYLSSENELGFRTRAAALLLRPAALRDVGIGDDSTATTLQVTRGDSAWTVTLAGVPGAGFTLPVRGDAPLYRRRAGEKFWWTYLPAERTVFVKYNQCRDPEDFKRLTDSVATAIDAEHPLRVVVDLRDNSGGDSRVVEPLIDALRSRGAINRPDALYVAMGRATVSSGLMAAVALKQRTRATLIGEATGERANHYGELRSFALPHSGLQVSYSTKFFQIVDGNADALVPDVAAPPALAAYLSGRDPVMDWILAHSRTTER